MSYQDVLAEQVKTLFAEVQDIEDLQQQVVDLLQTKAKESFKNGLNTARSKGFKTKGQKAEPAQ